MNATRSVSYQDVLRKHAQRWRRQFDVRVRGELPAKLSQEQSTGKTSSGALGQFARFCVVGTSNAVIDFGVLNMALAACPAVTARGFSSLSQDKASKDCRVQEFMSIASLKQSMEV